MKLLLDIGNSRIKVATLTENGLSVYDPITVSAPDDHRRLCEVVAPLTAGLTTCLASSVANPALNRAIEQSLSPLNIQWASSQASAAGIINGYPDPSQLGVDRWVSMLGLTRHFGRAHPPIVLASFGTATTVDTLSPTNRFEGGLILPGITMMHQALASGTANLPHTTGAIEAFPTNTVNAISSGVVAAQIGAVTRQVTLAAQRFGQVPVLCVTGGARSAIMDALAACLPGAEIKELPHVVLEGLCMLAAAPD